MKITISGSDARAVDAAMRRILDLARGTATEFRGPIPLPGRGARRSLDLVTPGHKMMSALGSADLPLAVSVEVRA